MMPSLPGAAVLDNRQDPLLEHALLSAFLGNVPDLVYFKDRDSRFIAVSRSKALRHGLLTSDLVAGKTDADFFSETHARRAREDEEQIMRTGAAMIGKLEKITWPDGRETWAVSNKMPLRDGSGEIIGTFGISKDVTDQKIMEASLEKAHRDLVDTSRLAGMAEVATGVLHNVGNVLNSLNVSATMIASGLRQSKTQSLAKVSDLMRAHADDLGAFLTTDPKGQLIPAFIESLARHALEERERLIQEVDSLQKNIDHIKEIVAMQQAYATMVGHVEPLDAKALMEDSLSMNIGALHRHDVRVVRDFQAVPPVVAEKAKVLQILVNLIRNAKYACDEGGVNDKVLTLRIEPGAPGRVRFVVEDDGVGIPAENLTRIFAHGFTTRPTGHGFGLHSSALAARDMDGTLTAQSNGPGTGATFVLDLPVASAEAAAPAPARSTRGATC